jgi:phospholipid/cholesterol/gamma-HCH transport system ATP-binding protein
VTRFSEEEFIPVRRHVAMVFQGSALFDSLSVGENVAYPLLEHFPDMPVDEVRRRVEEKLALVNLPGTERMMPADLSGGMKKRVGLARAIATDAEVILWDEPTTGLDPVTTQSINALINSTKTKLGSTSIVVTHDLVSAFAVGDRIAMLANRRIVQVGTPEELRRSTVPEVRAFLDARRVELVPGGAS